MRSLNGRAAVSDEILIETPDGGAHQSEIKLQLDRRLQKLKGMWHSGCLFNQKEPARSVRFSFDADGSLFASLVCPSDHQGYDGIVHGGVLASLVDASMAQCLMGHGIVAFTAELKLRYRKPVRVNETLDLRTLIHDSSCQRIFRMKTSIRQQGSVCVNAVAKFYRSDEC
ncbi:MAG: PaaI family thioesterase [Chitinivibrionales bacterium]